MKKPKRICPHDTKKNTRDAIMFRCACGNVWLGGAFFGSVPRDQSATSVVGAFSRRPARGEEA